MVKSLRLEQYWGAMAMDFNVKGIAFLNGFIKTFPKLQVNRYHSSFKTKWIFLSMSCEWACELSPVKKNQCLWEAVGQFLHISLIIFPNNAGETLIPESLLWLHNWIHTFSILYLKKLILSSKSRWNSFITMHCKLDTSTNLLLYNWNVHNLNETVDNNY